MSNVLRAPYALEYTYKRSLGPVMSRFFTALAGGTLLGAKTKSGRVIAPPAEYDESGEAIVDLVEVGPAGTVTTWTWIEQPRRNHPLAHPFAFALVKLDGADTAMLHAVDAGDASRMKTGMRVRARFAPIEKRGNGIRDLACFEPFSVEEA